ncbi:MAG: biotin/lipoyl-binding protein [Anaerolineae bacterium]|nr:biotin/lipoyl-binding protein [Anaerolineae bacterium]
MRRTVRNVLLGSLAVAAIAAVVFWRVSVSRSGEEGYRSAVVERGTLLVVISASGSIQPNERAELSFAVPGRVEEVLVDVGDAVNAGDVLARMDGRQLELQVKQVEAALMLAQSQLAQIVAPPRPEEIERAEANLRAAEAQIETAAANRDRVVKGASDAQIAGAQAQVASAELQVKVSQDAYDRTVRDTDDEDRIEDANYDLYVVKEGLGAAQAELDRLLAGADSDEVRAAQASLSAATAQRDAAQAQLDLLLAGPVDEQVIDAEAQVAQAEAGVESAIIALENTELVAPFDGLVAAVNIAPNELPSGPFAAIRLLDTSRYVLVVPVDEVDVGRLDLGSPVDVTVDALPELAITGRVERIASVATIEGGVIYYDVTVALDPTEIPIRADMSAHARIVVAELDDVLMLPTWVVRVDRTTGQTYVDVPAGEAVERIDVTLGARYEGYVEVLAGLEEGDVPVYRTDDGFGPFGGGE